MISPITISVLVPTWKRPKKLSICLDHLLKQVRQADEVIVIMRAEDIESKLVVEQFVPVFNNLKIVLVDKPGVVAAENAGLRAARFDYIAFIDDDGYAPINWLEKIEKFFQNNPNAKALGGSDIIMSEPWTYHNFPTQIVGVLTWYGKVIGNHHRKCTGDIRKVQILKGVNMIFRRSAFTFLDEKLAGIEGHLGNGSQWEFDLCLTLINNKMDIFFDPNLLVTHDSDHSNHDKLIAAKNNAHNLSYVMIKHLKFHKYIFFLFYALVLGNEQLPGLAKMLITVIKSKSIFGLKIYLYKLIGFFKGILTHLN